MRGGDDAPPLGIRPDGAAATRRRAAGWTNASRIRPTLVRRMQDAMALSHEVDTLRTESQLRRVAGEVANQRRELIYTTVTMDRAQHQLVMLRQWFGNLRAAACHALLIGMDAHTCALARNASLPCFVDGLAPSLRGKQNGFGPQVLVKWWYALALLRANHHVVFSDPDVAWIADPFAAWPRGFDLQGLSDTMSVNITTRPHHEITCNRGWMDSMYRGVRTVYPCQSTGLWYLRDGAASRAFLMGLHGYLSQRTNEWEQKAFQLIVVRFLIGLGDDLPPLRYRLLPTSRYINMLMYEQRCADGLNTSETVAVHCGYLNAYGDKFEHLENGGFLDRGLQWHYRMAAAVQGTPFDASRARATSITFKRKRNSSYTTKV